MSVTSERRHGGDVVVVRSGGAEAVIAVRGAQVLSFVPADGDEVLWLSPVADLAGPGAVRGGIPVCWPWFGPADTSDGVARPAHGVARTARWSPVAADGDGARFALTTDAGTRRLWPHEARVELTVAVGPSLRVALETENTGGTAFSLSQALHTYLAVGDLADVTVSGLEGCPYVDKVDGGAVRPPAGKPVTVGGEVDRIYQDVAGDVTVEDGRWRRRLVVATSGSRSTVLWNPWVDKGERLGDLGEHGYRRFVCVEAANAGADTVVLNPGDRHRLETALTSTPL
jgi:glucose-6-phosphate 1-epimerase